jgi:hypothetical protein
MKLAALVGVLTLALAPAIGDQPASAAEHFVGPNITYVGFTPAQMNWFFAEAAEFNSVTWAAFWACAADINSNIYSVGFSDCYVLLTWGGNYSYPLMHWWAYFNYDLVFAWSIPGNYFLGNEPEGPV